MCVITNIYVNYIRMDSMGCDQTCAFFFLVTRRIKMFGNFEKLETFDVSLSIILLLLKKTEMSRSIRFSVHLESELSIKFSKSHSVNLDRMLCSPIDFFRRNSRIFQS